MKKIYIIRHAKAEQDFAGSDFERSLTKKGKEQIKEMLKRLKHHALKPNIILASPAKRTTQTARLFARGLKLCEKAICFEPSFYEADAAGLFAHLKGLNDDITELCVVGHNPALRDLCELLSQIYISSFPTCSVFGLEFDAQKFADIKEHSGKLLFFEHLKKLKEG